MSPLLVGGGLRDATLELRGRMLLVISVERYTALTQAFDTTGATYQKRQLGLGAIALWWCGLAVALYLAYLFFHALFAHHAIPAVVVTGAIGLVAAWFLFSRQRIQRTPTLHLRLNANGGVRDLVIAYTPGANPALDEILSHMRPFEERYHQYHREKFGCISSDCLMAFPAHYIGACGAFVLVHIVVGSIGIAAVCFSIVQGAPIAAMRIFLLQFLLIASGGLFSFLATLNLYRTKRKVPEVQVALRSALGYLRAGEFESAEPVLRAATEAYPDDETLVSLRAQIAVIRGHYDDAEHILKTQPKLQVFNLEQLQTIRELLQEE